MKYLIFFVLLIMTSCVSVKWKYNYVGSRFIEFQKYAYSDSSVSFTIPSDFSTKKTLRKMSKAQIIRKMDMLEKGTALFPDSTSINNHGIDSFYINQYKVQYIKDHGLVRKNIILIKK